MSALNAMYGSVGKECAVAAPSGVGNAEGVPACNWYVAVVKNNTELNVRSRLEARGVECYVPVQREMRLWKNGRRSNVDRVVIPAKVFVFCTEASRRDIVALPYIKRFMTDRASIASGTGAVVRIPDAQMSKLMFMVGNSETPVTFTDVCFSKGDLVKVIRGRLAGLEGVVHRIDDKQSELIVNIDFLGSAKLSISTLDVERIGTG